VLRSLPSLENECRSRYQVQCVQSLGNVDLCEFGGTAGNTRTSGKRVEGFPSRQCLAFLISGVNTCPRARATGRHFEFDFPRYINVEEMDFAMHGDEVSCNGAQVGQQQTRMLWNLPAGLYTVQVLNTSSVVASRSGIEPN
jgi:hypothetical protein